MASEREGNALLDLKTPPPKRARKDVANKKSPLLSLPGEIRNRIYELALADTMRELNGRRIRLTYGLIKASRQLSRLYLVMDLCPTTEELESWQSKFDTYWRAAHGQCKYWGLIQACQVLRQEFRPLQQRTLPFTILAQHLSQYLYAFGTTEDALTLGKSLTAIIKQPLLPGVRLDILPLLRKLSKQRKSLPWLTERSLGEESRWKTSNLLTTLFYHWAQPPKGLEVVERDIASVTLTMGKVHGTHGAHERPSMIIGLRCACFTDLTSDEKGATMLDFIKATGLEKLHYFITEFRCCERRYTWHQSGATESRMQISEVQDED
ncbi:uncharacterized protein J4E78_003355 [Alternaria triticimaculans]|uniref:uncharacterized protein n=1 Tax=Alternaria triticimaculans TaxID=297637 RepID=UPI0020C20C30|nr:uncharacterized protein J4E78_003355 [Alternaria triticimaculans]KAI4665890.1 hypothetical protein J4E78_003355 [Alternaria triticimaculans]